ncbi:MAG: bifunctional folylpolyglutamate synthase/dihydrofolate synthase [Acidobacteria bacterium]|nr:bifunctional folylpolyglutamate synthase/dihydrofolate synthase [Acidobacteriota bacterium]
MPSAPVTQGPRAGDEEHPSTHLARLEARGHWGIKKGLEHPRALLENLGRPDRNFPIVLVAGTNGKGSVGAFLAHAFRAAGLVVGWTTSPHLVSPTERVWVDGSFIGEGALDLLVGEAFEAEERLGIQATYFELMIVAALLGFRMLGAEIAVVEVGLGGRWDATNATDPILTVLTSVGLEHQVHLGETREAIAREKLCTAREGRALVLGPTLDPAWVRPLLECRPAVFPALDLWAESVAWDHSVVRGHRIALAGAHQVQNLSTALEAVRQLRYLGFPLPEEAVWRGFSEARIPGRLWRLPGLDQVWGDGAHNPAGAAALASHAVRCGVRPDLFFGAMKDKDLPGMAAELRRTEPRSVTLVHGPGERYADGGALCAAWGRDLPVLDLPRAAARLREPGEGPRLVTGSLYLLGDLLAELGIRPEA